MEAPSAKTNISIELNYIPHINLALQQNGLPFIHELKLTNNTGEIQENLSVTIDGDVVFMEPLELEIQRLEPYQPLALNKFAVKLDYHLLATMTAAVQAQLRLRIKQGENLLLEQSFPLEIHPADHWLGLDVLPELLCSFVTPKMDVISQLMNNVSQLLQQETEDSSINGYQCTKERTYQTVKAIYNAILTWNINYSMPPASFGKPGQSVRFADNIYKFRLATCLDSTLLFASLMEQCNLHPVLMLTNGHAYVGCHLKDENFSNTITDDLQAIRKLVELDLFIVLETTCITRHDSFKKAEETARQEHLLNENEFEAAIDVVRARLSGIHPLPILKSVDGIDFAPPEVEDTSNVHDHHTRALNDEVDLSQLSSQTTVEDRVTRWQQKLLDLSLRNRLLNVRDNQLVIPLVCKDVTKLEDTLAGNSTLKIDSIEQCVGEKDLLALSSKPNATPQDVLQSVLHKELDQKRLWSQLNSKDLKNRLVKLYRQIHSDLDEGGVNTLYLAIGFLNWRETAKKGHDFLAPLILMPLKMTRRTISEGVTISKSDEDTIINVTLLELLKQDYKLIIPGLDPLPQDASGVDVNLILNIFRTAIKNLPGWEVLDIAKIGQFSFGKFIMWNDMTARADALRANPIVEHLVQGGGIFDDHIEVFPPEEIASHVDFEHLYCPLNADSSQLTAIKYSELGKSFVLHGPPGTGKSQTIANLIAHNLTLGRRVLFVSEKKAALDVVHKRLSKIGLKPFCLELHSNKAGKSEVLAQFSEALNMPNTATPEDWNLIISKLTQARAELNEYVNQLHATYPNGFSAYHCFSRLITAEATPENLLNVDTLTQTKEQYEALRDCVRKLASALRDTRPDGRQALSCYHLPDWNPLAQRQLEETSKQLLEQAIKLQAQIDKLSSTLALPGEHVDDFKELQALGTLLQTMLSAPCVPASFLTTDLPVKAQEIKDFHETYNKYDECLKRLGSYNLDEIAKLDCNGLRRRIMENNGKFFVFKFFANRSLITELKSLKRMGSGKLTPQELLAAIPIFEQYTLLKKQIDQNLPNIRQILGDLWQENKTDWNDIQSKLDTMEKIHANLTVLAQGHEQALAASLQSLQGILPQAPEQLRPGSALHTDFNTFVTDWNQFSTLFEQQSTLFNQPHELSNLPKFISTIEASQPFMPQLRYVSIWQEQARNAEANGLSGLVQVLANGTLPANAAMTTFENAYLRDMLYKILANAPALSRFAGQSHQEKIRLFCELDSKYTALTKGIIVAKLTERLPRKRSEKCPEGSELGLLKRECEKKTRQRPVRQLLEQLPTLVPALKPCFLMSPLSVAQYLPPDNALFDMIVFDEASQIPVWDAIGVIARGKQLIVVGDPKQMPPTNFFQKNEAPQEEDTAEEVVAEDMESILDECLAAGLHSSFLNWHYRSRHESLIAFSNQNYYDNKLLTFPSASNSPHLGVVFKYVPEATYDRRKSRTNVKEAQALVDYLMTRFDNPELKDKSIGIVTFSQSQKDLIDDLLEEARAKHPQYEPFFSDSLPEPLFVKNLENVQGDERDVIMFSICYAPDKDNKFMMNFGPLNRAGGERRLNVAITRAKEQVIVFSSIHGSQIDLSRTSAIGASHLHAFLNYAEKGPVAQQPRLSANANSAKDGTIDAAEAFLTGKGYKVRRAIGCSDCKIDLGVLHPDDDTRYILGIECDGSSYAHQATTRDRDEQRFSVLNGLGWNMLRLWSVDWAFDRQFAELALEKAVQNAVEKAQNTVQDVSTGTNTPEAPSGQTPADTGTVPLPPAQAATADTPQHVYQIWTPAEKCDHDLFFEPHTKSLLTKQIFDIVETEGPIYESLVHTRLLRAWEITRTTDSVRSLLAECFPAEIKSTSGNDGDRILWPSTVNPEDFDYYRVPATPEERRNLNDIPPCELINAAREVDKDFQGCDKDTLYKEVVKLFGYSVLTPKAKAMLDSM